MYYPPSPSHPPPITRSPSQQNQKTSPLVLGFFARTFRWNENLFYLFELFLKLKLHNFSTVYEGIVILLDV